MSSSAEPVHRVAGEKIESLDSRLRGSEEQQQTLQRPKTRH